MLLILLLLLPPPAWTDAAAMQRLPKSHSHIALCVLWVEHRCLLRHGAFAAGWGLGAPDGSCHCCCCAVSSPADVEARADRERRCTESLKPETCGAPREISLCWHKAKRSCWPPPSAKLRWNNASPFPLLVHCFFQNKSSWSTSFQTLVPGCAFRLLSLPPTQPCRLTGGCCQVPPSSRGVRLPANLHSRRNQQMIYWTTRPKTGNLNSNQPLHPTDRGAPPMTNLGKAACTPHPPMSSNSVQHKTACDTQPTIPCVAPAKHVALALMIEAAEQLWWCLTHSPSTPIPAR